MNVNFFYLFRKILNRSQIILEDIIKRINSLIYSFGRPTTIVTGFILILSGILLSFWGYRLKKFAILILGFVTGAIFGFYLSSIFAKDSFALTILLALIFGLTISLLMNFLYKATIVIIGVLLGFSLSFFVVSSLSIDRNIAIVIILFFVILSGFLSIKVEKIMFIIITCYYGYIIFRLGLGSFGIIKDKTLEEVISLSVLIGGAVFQFYEQFLQKDRATATIEESKSGEK